VTSTKGNAVSQHRFERERQPTLRNWGELEGPEAEALASDVTVQCGWGRLVFGYTFRDPQKLAQTLCSERAGERDIALYLRDPHVVLSMAPAQLFLDPSHTYRLWHDRYRPSVRRFRRIAIRRAANASDVGAMNRLYSARAMVPVDPDFVVDRRNSRTLVHLVAEDVGSGEIVGTVTGVDHHHAFADPEHGSSLWCLAVDPQAQSPGVGEALVRHLAEILFARGRAFMDLSVMHDNSQAIGLYEKLGFQRVPVFCLKHKNPINEPLFTEAIPGGTLNPYAQVIVKEARLRGIVVDVIDDDRNLFSLTYGGRTIRCQESLTDLTSATAFNICDDKRLCRKFLRRAGLPVPEQRPAGSRTENLAFLDAHGSVVVKPVRGEQGVGISVDVRDGEELLTAIERAHDHCDDVILEQYVAGQDLRVVVIGYEVVAAAIRRLPQVQGTGQDTIEELIRKQSRRRAAATGGESRIPEDDETERCVRRAGYALDDVLPVGEVLEVRRTANLHTGGTIHDVTDDLSPRIAEATVLAARTIEIPVVGFDLIVPRVDADDYVFIEANERPGLANHEPRPTAERFVDLLFPHTVATAGSSGLFGIPRSE
jgi:GNAT-family acetyltransferase (TIGR03103 family)